MLFILFTLRRVEGSLSVGERHNDQAQPTDRPLRGLSVGWGVLLGCYNSSSHRTLNKLGEMDACMLPFAVRYPMIFPPLIITGGVLVYSLKGEYEPYSLPKVEYLFHIEFRLCSLP